MSKYSEEEQLNQYFKDKVQKKEIDILIIKLKEIIIFLESIDK
tara:strand:- start:970 stop:1098 length:129 start_codon:yes stop_codon:yes gene_type:complete